MKTSVVPFVLAALSLGAFVGCNTSGRSARIQEKSAIFASLGPDQQKYIQRGGIEVGYTADMVYMALGKPSKTKLKDSPDGPVEMWTFYNYLPTVNAVHLVTNRPGSHYSSGQVSSSLPNENSLGPTAPSLFSTSGGGPEPTLNVADMPVDTLYVFFFHGKVFKIQLESETPPETK